MKLRYLVLLLAILLLLSGCGGGDHDAEGESAPPDGEVSASPAEEPSENGHGGGHGEAPEPTPPLFTHEFMPEGKLEAELVAESYAENPEETAETLAHMYIDAMKAGVDLAGGANALGVMDFMFYRSSLEVADVAAVEDAENSFTCVIKGRGKYGAREIPLTLTVEHDKITFVNPYTKYGAVAFNGLGFYFQYIYLHDAESLAAWMYGGHGAEEHLGTAEKILEHFSGYNLRVFEVTGVYYDFEAAQIVYSIKDGDGNAFDVHMALGEGDPRPDISFLETEETGE